MNVVIFSLATLIVLSIGVVFGFSAPPEWGNRPGELAVFAGGAATFILIGVVAAGLLAP